MSNMNPARQSALKRHPNLKFADEDTIRARAIASRAVFLERQAQSRDAGDRRTPKPWYLEGLGAWNLGKRAEDRAA